MPRELCLKLARGAVPDPDRSIPGGGGEAVAGGGEAHDLAPVAFETVEERAGGQVPDDHRVVVSARGGAVAGERDHPVHGGGVAVEPEGGAVRGGGPDPNRIVEACRKEGVAIAAVMHVHHRAAMALKAPELFRSGAARHEQRHGEHMRDHSAGVAPGVAGGVPFSFAWTSSTQSEW